MDSDDIPSCSGASKLSEQDSKLIAQAKEEFDKEDYGNCIQTLSKLEESIGSSPRLRHNKAIAEFYKSGCTTHDDLLHQLENLTLHEDNKSKDATAFNTRDSLSPIAKYNISLIYLNKQKLYSAIGILEPLISKLDELENKMALPAGLLMINLLLKTNQLKRAKSLLDLMETKFNILNEKGLEDGSAGTDKLFNKDLTEEFKLMSVLVNILNKNKNVVVPDHGSLEESALKAHQYYLMKDFQMASKQLLKINQMKSSHKNCQSIDAWIANNMGIIHMHVRHYAIATNFFQKAVNFERQMVTNVNLASLNQLGCMRTNEIFYHLGLSLLHLRRPKDAFQCFLIPVKTFHSNPRLWLRLAEACIMDYEMSFCQAGRRGNNSPGVTSGTVLVSNRENTKTEPEEPSLEFAVLCLRNAVYLAHSYREQFTKLNAEQTDADTQDWKTIRDSNFCNPSMPVSKESFDAMLCAIYAASCYVALRIGDYVTAQEHALELLKMENLSDAYKMLAQMYLAEASVLAEKLSDGRRYFETALYSASNAYDFETKNWEIKSVDQAQAIARYNIVAILIMQGEYEAAGNLLNTCSHPIVASKAMELKSLLDKIRTNNE